MRWIILVTLLWNAFGIYREQVGKYDWNLTHLGRIQHVSLLPTNDGPRFLVGSSRGVLALLKPTGLFEWRKIPHGLDHQTLYESQYNCKIQLDIITYSKNASILNVWNAVDCQLLWTKDVAPGVSQLKILKSGLKDYILLIYENEVKVFSASLGSQVYSLEREGVAGVLEADDSKYFDLALSKGPWKVLRVELSTGKVLNTYQGKLEKGQVFCGTFCIRAASGTAEIFQAGKLVERKLPEPEFVIGNLFGAQGKLYKVVETQADPVEKIKTGRYSVPKADAQYHASISGGKLTIQQLTRNSPEVEYEGGFENVEISDFWSIELQTGMMHFVVLSDFSFYAFLDGKMQWKREEALGHAKGVYFAEFPIGDSYVQNAYFSAVMYHNTWDQVLQNFSLRIMSQIDALSNHDLPVNKELLSKDEFGFNKLIVINTEPGKLFGLHSISKEVLWSINFKSSGSVQEVLQINHQDLLVIRKVQEGTELVWCSVFGKILKEELISGFKFVQSVIIAHENYLLVDEDLKVHALNKNIEEVLNGHPVFITKIMEGRIAGFQLQPDLTLVQVWNILLSANEIIQSISSPKSGHKEQATIATGDSRLLYKFLDDNNLAIATLSTSNAPKGMENTLHLYIVNQVTGRVVTKLRQTGVRAPVNLVFRQNWVVAHYWSIKGQRYEFLSVELFEQKVDTSALDVVLPYLQSTDSDPSASSYTQPNPVIFTKTFICPTGVKALGATETHQGITNQDILMILNNNDLYALSRRFLSPRRKPEDFEEQSLWDEPALPMYKPLLPINPTKVLNYYLPLEGFENVKTTWVQLESTSLAVFYGLDLFVVRVMPEKSFDMLTEEFNYQAIVLTIVLLVGANVVIFYYYKNKTLYRHFSE